MAWLGLHQVIKDRLQKELEKNVALRVTDTESADTYEVAGRGQMHLTVLIENMRREGFELMIGPPQVSMAGCLEELTPEGSA